MPMPTLFSAYPNKGVAGDTITINGEYLTGATAVLFDAKPAASFTVVDDNTITVVVPRTRATTHDFTVTTPGGTSTDSNGFRILFPGPWVQPVDGWFDEPASGFYQGGSGHYGSGGVYANSQPDIGGTVALDVGHTGSNFLAGDYDVTYSPPPPGTVHDDWLWDLDVYLVAIDLTAEIDGTHGGGLPSTAPTSGELTAPHVVTYQLEAPFGAALGPIEIKIGPFGVGGSWSTPPNGALGADSTLDVFQSRGIVARVPDSDYTIIETDSEHFVGFTHDDIFPSDALINGLTPIIDAPMARDDSDVSIFGSGGFANNSAQSGYDIAQVIIPGNLSDLDGNRRYALACWIDRTFTLAEVSHVHPGDGAKSASINSVSGALFISVNYRPPRYRLLYDEAQIPELDQALSAGIRPVASLQPSLHTPEVP